MRNRTGACVLISTLIISGCGSKGVSGCSQVASVSETTITLEAPSDAWSAGAYTLALTFNGRVVQCTMTIPDAASFSTSEIQGTCAPTEVAWTYSPICSQPTAVCDATACGQTASSGNCQPGKFRMTVVLFPAYVPDGGPSNPEEVNLSLMVNGMGLVDETIAPEETTTQPNGAGCGTSVNGSATVSVPMDGG